MQVISKKICAKSSPAEQVEIQKTNDKLANRVHLKTHLQPFYSYYTDQPVLTGISGQERQF